MKIFRPMSEETRRNMSIAHLGNKNAFGLRHTQEFKKRIKERNSGANNFFFGKKHTIESRKKISEVAKKNARSDAFVEYLKANGGNLREKNPAWKGGISRGSYSSTRRERERSAEGTHTRQQWEDLKKFYNYMCLCCKQQEPFINLAQDHIIPLSRGGSDDISNIQPLCMRCNCLKHVKTVDYRPSYA